jgi:hypothetical protein
MKYILATLFCATLTAPASVLVTYAEDAFAYNSSLSGTSVYDFNNLSTGLNTNVAWSGVGTFDQLFIKNPDTVGGAADSSNPNGTRYSVQGAGTSVVSTTLFLNTDSSYFGMWWSAGDARNVLSFYDGDNLVARFTTATLLEPLPANYDGNPRNKNIQRHEPFAFINFFGDETTSWDRIVLNNIGYSGFESDNYTSRVAGWNPATDDALPGVVVASVTGTTTTSVTKADLANTRWSLNKSTVANAPGAPVPPWVLLGAFGAVAVLRNTRKEGKEQHA